MASSKEYLNFVLEQLSELDGVTFRPMMGEYLLYVQGKLFGGIYDDRLLVKPVPAAVTLLSPAIYEAPYPGVKEMLLVESLDDRESLCGLVKAMVPELPQPKTKRQR